VFFCLAIAFCDSCANLLLDLLLRETPVKKQIIQRQFLAYLAGPITGLAYESATDWRQYVIDRLPPHIVGVSPLRGKDYLPKEENLKEQYPELHPMSTEDGIMTRDFFDVHRADALLVNFLEATRVSIGTVMEISWAHMLRKPVVVVMEKDNIHQHPMLRKASSLIVPSLDAGIDLVDRLISPA